MIHQRMDFAASMTDGRTIDLNSQSRSTHQRPFLSWLWIQGPE
jgi:hypothetical protein